MSDYKLKDAIGKAIANDAEAAQAKKFSDCWAELKAVLARYGFGIVHRSVVINGQPTTSELVLVPEPPRIITAAPSQLPRNGQQHPSQT